jgi:hypothetical protein
MDAARHRSGGGSYMTGSRLAARTSFAWMQPAGLLRIAER